MLQHQLRSQPIRTTNVSTIEPKFNGIVTSKYQSAIDIYCSGGQGLYVYNNQFNVDLNSIIDLLTENGD